jgi:glycosyltransferase involved in cell wall biosynthesis
MKKVLIVCTTDSMFTNFLIPHIKDLLKKGCYVECACSRTGNFIDELRESTGVIVNEIGFERSPYTPKNIRAFKHLNKIVKQKAFDTIICHEPVGGVMGRIVGHLNHCKVIYMAHGFHFYKGAPRVSKLYYYVEKALAHWTDILVTINKEDYEASLKFKSKHKFLLPGIGIDIHKFEYAPNKRYIREAFNLTNDDYVCLSVGELIPRKNHEVVIRAIAQLDNKHIHYFIAGDGELQLYLSELSEKLGVKEQIHFLGYRKDINKLCNSADIYILPSLQEGLSVALMEAMATCKVIIASRIRGNVDLIDEDKGGVLVAAKDVEEYARAISYVITNKNLWDEIGKHNIEKVKNFSIESVQEQMELVYELLDN